VPQESKEKFAVFTEVSPNAVSKTAPAKGKSSESMPKVKRKKQAEEPIYLSRM
jgi:hypothetical protein